MQLGFSGDVIEWRGPAPHHFVAVPEPQCDSIHAVAPAVTYGWGVIPVSVRVGDTAWSTSLFPKDGGYLVPLKLAVCRAERIEAGDTVDLVVSIAL